MKEETKKSAKKKLATGKTDASKNDGWGPDELAQHFAPKPDFVVPSVVDAYLSGRETHEAPRPPDWKHWGQMVKVSIDDAATLSLNLDPPSTRLLFKNLSKDPALWDDYDLNASEIQNELKKRKDLAQDHARAKKLLCSTDDGNFFVTLGDFRALGESLPTPFTFPPEYPKATPKAETQKEVTQEKSGKIIKGNDKLFGSQDSIEPEENEEDAMRSNQRENLYCIIAALEKDASLTAKTLHIKMKRDGVEISERTIGRAFEEAKKVYKEKKSQSTNNK